MMEFSLLGKKVIIPEDRVRYNELKSKYTRIAYESEIIFRETYEENNKNIEDVVKNVFGQGNEIIERIVSRSEEINFNKISINNFIETYYLKYLLDWQESCNEIYDKYMDIVLTEEEKDAYRKYRKDARGRWQGGGFGIKGAISGSVQAGALNMASGIAHSAFNMAGKAISTIKANSKKSKLYRDKRTLDNLSKELNYAIFSLHLAIKDYLHDNTNVIIKGVYEEDILIAESKLKRIVDKDIENSKKIDELIEIVNIYPYSESAYQYMVQEFGDNKKEIEKIAHYFGCNLSDYKENLLNEKFKTLNLESEEATIRTKEIIIDEINRLGLNENQECIIKINQKLKEYDKIARSVNGVLFNTREEAYIANKESKIIEEILSTTKMNDRISIKETIETLKNIDFKTNILESYMSDLQLKLKDLELELRTIYIKPLTIYKYNSEIKKIIMDTVEDAELARKEQRNIETWYNELQDKENLEQILIEKINNEIKTQIKVEYINQLKDEIDKIKDVKIARAKLYEDYKTKFRNYMIGLPIYSVIGLYCFFKFGIIVKIFIVLITFGLIENFKDTIDDYVDGKQAFKEITNNGKMDLKEGIKNL